MKGVCTKRTPFSFYKTNNYRFSNLHKQPILPVPHYSS
jgi:hypothetical protein